MRAALPGLKTVELAGPTSEYDGMRIAYREAGDASSTAIVCMHGIGSSSAGYAGQLSGLANSFRVVSWDAPGYGGSDALPWSEPRPESYADALAGFCTALRIDRLVVVGSSFGAVIAAAFAMRYPDRVLGLVLSAPAAGFARSEPAERTAALAKRIGDMQRLGPAGVARERASALVAPGSPQPILDAAAELVASVRPEGYYQAAHALDMADTVAVAARISAPSVVVVGEKDIVTPLKTCAEPISRELRNGRIKVVDGIGHLVKLEAPDIFNDVVRDFVGSLPPR